MNTKKVGNIDYELPIVYRLYDTGIGSAEFAARTAYDSFDVSENEIVKTVNNITKRKGDPDTDYFSHQVAKMNEIEESNILDTLAWTYFHHSVLEHASLSYLIKGISRGVLQELARHRIASYTVRSTRYTMGAILNAFNASQCLISEHGVEASKDWFAEKLSTMKFLVTVQDNYNRLEYDNIYNKLSFQKRSFLDDEWKKLTLSKDALNNTADILDPDVFFDVAENSKKKRNVGDKFKHIVTDNWKVDLVMTMNIRSLKNFLDLRDSGSAWFQIQWLAKAIKKQTPKKYLKLITKKLEE